MLSLSVAALPFKCFSGVANAYCYLYSAMGADRERSSRMSRSLVKTQPTSFNFSHCTASYWHFLHPTYVHLRWQWTISIHILDLGCLYIISPLLPTWYPNVCGSHHVFTGQIAVLCGAYLLHQKNIQVEFMIIYVDYFHPMESSILVGWWVAYA
jgi:hypothetical protein